MSLISEDLTGRKINKVKQSIDRLKTFEPAEGYFLAFSGGKDSIVIKALADMANVKYDAHYSVTTVDPPELVMFIRDKHKDVLFDKPELSMRQLIIKKMIPPSRINRYCCEALKEVKGDHRVVITGARWAESTNRRNNQGVVSIFGGAKFASTINDSNIKYKVNKNNGIVLNDDNDESRRLVEQCYRTNKTIVNPIVDWSDEDVWEFIRSENITYCSLYDEGWGRLGCVGCPLAMNERRKEELERWPVYYKVYLHAFRDMLNEREKRGKGSSWNDAQEVMDWWLRKNPKIKKVDGQESFL